MARTAQTSNEERGDGLREKMISINRVTKVVKGGRIMVLPRLPWLADGEGGIGMGKGKSAKFRWPCRSHGGSRRKLSRSV